MLKLAYVGGLGLMSSPAAVHLVPGGPARVLRVHDRGRPGAQRDAARAAWRDHGAKLVGTLEELIGSGDLDGVVVCCGKNGDDAPVLGRVSALLADANAGAPFLLHMSTVSTGFVGAARRFCERLGVAYVNYPLTGGPLGAQRGGGHPQGMLILASGDSDLYRLLEPTLALLGRPRSFGQRPEAGAETKLIGQHMVYNGCTGITAAAALHAQRFAAGELGGTEQSEYFEFLNGGAGGTRQWEVALSKGVRDGVWSEGFMIPHAVVDAIYAARLAIDAGLPRFSVQPCISIALAFSFLLAKYPGEPLGTHAVARELIGPSAAELDAFMVEHGAYAGDVEASLAGSIASLPPEVQSTVLLDVAEADFARDPGA